MITCYCKQTSTWKQSHPPDPPDSASPPQRTLRQISGDITFQEYLQVFVLVYQRFLLGLKLYFSKVRAWIFYLKCKNLSNRFCWIMIYTTCTTWSPNSSPIFSTSAFPDYQGCQTLSVRGEREFPFPVIPKNRGL